MSWYDTFSRFYDTSIQKIYAPYRPRIVQALAPEPGMTALDLACGTGQNFDALAPALAPGGALIGYDLSEGMLARAQARIDDNGWPHVRLVRGDAGALDAATLGASRVDRVVCTLGFSALPGWRAVFERAWDLLAPGGRFVIFDVHAERWVPQTSWVGLIAQADLKRRVWEPLEVASEGFVLQPLEGSPHIHGGTPILASGEKPLKSTM